MRIKNGHGAGVSEKPSLHFPSMCAQGLQATRSASKSLQTICCNLLHIPRTRSNSEELVLNPYAFQHPQIGNAIPICMALPKVDSMLGGILFHDGLLVVHIESRAGHLPGEPEPREGGVSYRRSSYEAGWGKGRQLSLLASCSFLAGSR